jgi:hypothetical protein
MTWLLLPTMLIVQFDCKRTARMDVEFLKKCRPLNEVGHALCDASSEGEILPDSQASLQNWVKQSKHVRDDWRGVADEFCRRGLYLTDIKDGEGKHHNHLLLYYVIVNDEPYVSFVSSDWAWGEVDLPVRKARTLFGNSVVDELIARSSDEPQK